MAATYRYVMADMLTGEPLEELPLDVSSYSQTLNGVGAATATLSLTGLKVKWRDATIPRRTTLNILRNNAVMWGGPIMKRHPGNNGTTCELTAETWEGYLGRRRVKSTLTYTNADVWDIVRGIINTIQAVTAGNVGLQVNPGAGTVAGYAQTITYNGYARVKVLDEIARLSQISPYFEYQVTVARNTAGNFVPTLNLAAPRFAQGVNPIVVEYPGMATSYDYPEDGAAAVNALTGIGKGDGASMLISEQRDDLGELASGFPIYEDELSLKDEDDLTRLTARTQTELASRLVDYVVPTIETLAGKDPQFTAYPLGTDCRLRVTSPYNLANADGSPGLDVTRRVTGWTVRPNNNGQETVTLSLSTGSGAIKHSPTDTRAFVRWLAEMENRVRNIETRR